MNFLTTKVRAVPLHAQQVLSICRGIRLRILNLDARKVWVVNATPRPFYPWERDPVPNEQEAG
jgi:hypothetical protein